MASEKKGLPPSWGDLRKLTLVFDLPIKAVGTGRASEGEVLLVLDAHAQASTGWSNGTKRWGKAWGATLVGGCGPTGSSWVPVGLYSRRHHGRAHLRPHQRQGHHLLCHADLGCPHGAYNLKSRAACAHVYLCGLLQCVCTWAWMHTPVSLHVCTSVCTPGEEKLGAAQTPRFRLRTLERG